MSGRHAPGGPRLAARVGRGLGSRRGQHIRPRSGSPVIRHHSGRRHWPALFRISHGGRLTRGPLLYGERWLTHLPAGDLVMTAAHCITGAGRGPVRLRPRIPGRPPPVRGVAGDPGDLRPGLGHLGRSRSRRGLSPGQEAGIGYDRAVRHWGRAAWPQPARGQFVRVTGYPDRLSAPITCENWVSTFSPTQLRFDCGGYTNGTSGSPLLADISPTTGLGTVIGVIRRIPAGRGYRFGVLRGPTRCECRRPVPGSYPPVVSRSASPVSRKPASHRRGAPRTFGVSVIR